MQIHFELRQGKSNKSGSRTIRAYIYHNGKSYYSTKFKVNEGLWDARRGRLKDIAPNCVLWNCELTRLRNEIEALCLKHPSLPADHIARMIGKKSINTFPAFFENFIKECESGKIKRSIGTVVNYRKVLNSINKFELRTDFDTICREWYDEYVGWLRTGSVLDKRKPQKDNSIGSHIKIIKAVMREAFDKGVSTNIEFQKKYFKQLREQVDSIYLTEKEIEQWENVDLTSFPHLQNERDRFLIQYYFIQRFGDTLRFDESNFYKQGENTFLKFRSEKTRTETILPVKKKAIELLEKYNFKMPKTTNQESNRDLKKIGWLAGITEMLFLNGEKKQKFDFITTHTARRSGATNLYFQNCPEKVIMDIGGWSDADTFRSYICLTKLQSAKKAIDYPFFK